jgi:hypothetical protein
MMSAGDPVPLEIRLAGALNNILGIYNIPPDVRETKIRRVFDMGYRNLGLRTFNDFKIYVNEAHDLAFRKLLNR